MSDQPVTLTEAELRQWAGGGAFKRAENYLASGKIIERNQADEGIIANWDERRNAFDPWLAGEYPDLEFDCSCPQGNSKRPCDHVVTLALAWVRAPQSFGEAPIDADEEDDEWDEADLGELEYEDEAPPLPAHAASPGPALSGGATTTLSLQPIDLKRDYLGLLERLSVPELRELAQRRGVTLTGNKRDPIIQQLADALNQPEAWRAAWPRLSPDARLVFKLLPFVTTYDQGLYQPHLKQALEAFDSAAAPGYAATLNELIAAGFVFSARDYLNYAPGLLQMLPPLPGFLPPLKESGQLRAVTAGGPFEFALLATRLLLALRADAPRLRARPAPAPHPVFKKLAGFQAWPSVPEELDALARTSNPQGALYTQTFTVPPAPSPLAEDARVTLKRSLGVDDERLDFALRLLAGRGLVELEPGQPVRVPEAPCADFLRQPLPVRLVELYNAWRNLTTWTEFDRLAARRPPVRLRRLGQNYSTYASLVQTLAGARTMLMAQIRNAPRGNWTDIGAFAVRARRLNVTQKVWPQNNLYWYPDWNNRPPNLTRAEDWNPIYGAYAEAVLTGPLFWLGLVELAYRKEQLMGFRPTEMGALLFGEREALETATPAGAGPPLSFAANGDLILRAETAEANLFSLLNLLGEGHVGAQGELLYTVTAAGATRAFEAGWEAEPLLAALAEAARKPAPAALAQKLRAWGQGFGAVQVYTHLALLELADDYALPELLANTSLAQHLLYRFSPRLIAVRPESVGPLREELVAKGYTPKVAT